MTAVLIILPSATYRAADFLAAARSLEAELLIASEGSQVFAGGMGDRFLRIDPSRPEWSAERIVALHRRHPFDAIVAVDDQGVVTAALAAQRLGLAHNPPDAVAATRDKAEMRRRFAAAGVVQPPFAVLAPGADPARAAAGIGYPVVAKPVSLAAGTGVIRADDEDALQAAVDRIRAILEAAGCDRDEPLLIEGYVPGSEHAVEGLVDRGEFRTLAVLDKPEPMEGPYFEETMFVTPSRLPPAVRRSVEDAAAAMAAAVGLRHGPVHAEARVDDGRVVALEVAARSIGGLCGRAMRFGLLGTSLETVLLRHALGFPPADLAAADAASGVMMLPIPRRGVFHGIDHVADALAVAGIRDLEITVPRGHEVVPLPEGDRYLGFMFARAASPDEVDEALRAAFSRLDVRIG